MQDRMYQISVMGILGEMLLSVKYYEPHDGHWQAVAETQRLFVLEQGSDLDADLRAISQAIQQIADAS